MTKEQAAILSQLAYLDWPDEKSTLNEFLEYYTKKENWPADKDWDDYKRTFEKASRDPYLRNLKISGYENDNGKSGFVGYAFSDNSGQGVVAFRGTEPGTLEDWVPENVSSAVLLETPQLKKAKEFMQNQAGDFSSIQLAGHSLGGRLAGQVALLDDRATDAYTFNAPGVSDAFFDATIGADKMLRNNF